MTKPSQESFAKLEEIIKYPLSLEEMITLLLQENKKSDEKRT